MSISVSKSAVVLLLLGGVWWLGRGDGGGSGEGQTADGGAAPADTRAMRVKLELAVTSAFNVAECGYTEVGYGHRTPPEAARHVVAMMASASATPGDAAPPPGPTVEYVQDRPDAPWQVVVRADTAHARLVIEGYGPDLSEPMFSREVPCSG